MFDRVVEVELVGVVITDEHARMIAEFKSLQRVTIDDTNLSDGVLSELREHLPQHCELTVKRTTKS